MKTKSYRYGKIHFKAYYKTVGHGYEVGLLCGKKTLFVGNFIHTDEATTWWKMMNKETALFAKKYWAAENVSSTWYCNFISTHLHKCYYKYLDTCFAKYTKTYTKAFSRDFRRYRAMKKNWWHEYAPVFRVA